MAVPSSILLAVRGHDRTQRTYTLKPADDLAIKLPVPKSFGTGNVDDAAVVTIAEQLGKVDTFLSGRGETVKDDETQKPKSEALKVHASDFAKDYGQFVAGKLPADSDASDNHKTGRKSRTAGASTNGASS